MCYFATAISALAADCPATAVQQLYQHMQQRGIEPTVATFGTLITIASESQAYDRCDEGSRGMMVMVMMMMMCAAVQIMKACHKVQ